MARRGSGGGFSKGGLLTPVLAVATGLLVLVILVIFAPTIAGSIEPGEGGLNLAISPTSNWNASHNADLPSGVSTWITNITILFVVVLIIGIGIAMYFLKGMV